ncbi:MAG: 50S ribosomal protein L11 methyltransferase [Alphaproteobacteria bacterium HGW-Alphaproteobacteria-16]|nr:MAG: 50S ribosomal protein L11 methyltransferase [Alphaproteobacteria bacterium HGW-Alphaproteobacteria-16]
MSWKLTLPCTRDEAEAIDFEDAELLALDPAPVLLTSETIPDDPLAWQLEAYFEDKPRKADIAAIRALVPSAVDAEPVIEQLADEDWVTLSQAGIEPVHAGRFYVHTSTNRGDVPPGAKTFQIEASRAFGTGTHETTAGCLMTLDAMRRRGEVVRNLIDVGTGTGLLAFAAMHLWPRAYATASDIDPVSVEVTAENATINGVPLGVGMGQLALAAAPGLEHPMLIGRAPYDLIIANVLAGPLIELAPSISAALAEGGTLIVAGLLHGQAERVANAYRRQGLRLAGRTPMGDWPTLRLRKRTRYGWGRVTRPGPDGQGLAPGFGSW